MMSSSVHKGRPGPDRGWSWVVAFAACFCSLVLAGIFRTSGVLFVAFIDAFGVTREEAAWPMVICISVLNLTGPLSGLLGQRYGVRPVVMTGSLIGAIGVAGCFFTSSLTVITVLFGGVFGVGYGLVNTLWPVIVNMYFLNMRGTANGIANSGSCFGSVLLPVFFEQLIDAFGLAGCFLLTGGVVLNVAVAGALMRTPSWVKYPPSNQERTLLESTIDPSYAVPLEETHRTAEEAVLMDNFSNLNSPSTDGVIGYDTATDNELPANLNRNSVPQIELQAELVRTLNQRSGFQSKDPHVLMEFPEESYDSIDTSDSSFNYGKNYVTVHSVDYELHKAQQEFEDSISDFQSAVIDITETSKSDDILNRIDPSEVKPSDLTDGCPARHSFSVAKRPPKKFQSPIPNAGPLRKHTYTFNSSGDITNHDLYPLCETKKDFEKSDSDEFIIPIKSMDEPDSSLFKDHTNKEHESLGTVKSFITVATSPMFYITAFSNVSFYILFHMFVNIIVDYSLDRGVPEEDTKYVLFSFSMLDLVGRLCFGWVTDRKYLTRSRFIMLGIAGIGMSFFAFPFATSFSALVVVSGCYGLLLGCSLIMFPILLVDYLGINLLPVAYGYLCFLNGFASFSRPFIIGYFRDNVGSYENIFYILGVLSLMASAVWMLERCFVKKDPVVPLTDQDVEQKME